MIITRTKSKAQCPRCRHKLDRDDLMALVRGSHPGWEVFKNPLLEKAGHRYSDQYGITRWDNLGDLSDSELYKLYLICKGSQV